MERRIFLLCQARLSPVRRAATAALLAVIGACAAPAMREEPLPASAPIAPELAVATFDTAWKRVGDTYYDSTMRGLDWVAARAELRPRAQAAATDAQLRAVIGELLSRLGESHFGLIPREAAAAIGAAAPDSESDEAGDAGMELRLYGDSVVVFRVDSGGGAVSAGVQPGWFVRSVDRRSAAPGIAAANSLPRTNDRTMARFHALAALERGLTGSAGSAVTVEFDDSQNRPRTVEITRRPLAGTPVRFGNLPLIHARLESSVRGAGANCAGVVRFNIWMTAIAPGFERAMQDASGCRGVVIDLRGNPGGAVGLIMGLGGFFYPTPTSLGDLRTRRERLRLVTNPRLVGGPPPSTYAGKVALVVDERSMSASEIFAAGLQQTGRARVFGSSTPGLALPAVMTRLPNGDVMMHVIADFVGPGGTRIEGRGVTPDRVIRLSRAGLGAGRDAALEAAVDWVLQVP